MHEIAAPQPGLRLLPEPKPVISAGEVAGLLNYRRAASFYSQRERLEALGFPKKLPGLNGWSRAAILRWIDRNGAEAPSPAELADDLAAERRRLEGEYAA